MLYQQLASQLDNGRPLVEAMEDFRDRLARRGRKGLAQAMREATSCLKDGKTFVQSMGPTLSPMERSVLASGEKAGQLTNSMRLVLDVRDRVTRIQRKVMSYFTAPIVYLITLLASLYVIGSSVVPPLAQVVPVSAGDEPFATNMSFPTTSIAKCRALHGCCRSPRFCARACQTPPHCKIS
jgi:type II secretory pathway component PulF